MKSLTKEQRIIFNFLLEEEKEKEFLQDKKNQMIWNSSRWLSERYFTNLKLEKDKRGDCYGIS